MQRNIFITWATTGIGDEESDAVCAEHQESFRGHGRRMFEQRRDALSFPSSFRWTSSLWKERKRKQTSFRGNDLHFSNGMCGSWNGFLWTAQKHLYSPGKHGSRYSTANAMAGRSQKRSHFCTNFWKKFNFQVNFDCCGFSVTMMLCFLDLFPFFGKHLLRGLNHTGYSYIHTGNLQFCSASRVGLLLFRDWSLWPCFPFFFLEENLSSALIYLRQWLQSWEMIFKWQEQRFRVCQDKCQVVECTIQSESFVDDDRSDLGLINKHCCRFAIIEYALDLNSYFMYYL